MLPVKDCAKQYNYHALQFNTKLKVIFTGSRRANVNFTQIAVFIGWFARPRSSKPRDFRCWNAKYNALYCDVMSLAHSDITARSLVYYCGWDWKKTLYNHYLLVTVAWWSQPNYYYSKHLINRTVFVSHLSYSILTIIVTMISLIIPVAGLANLTNAIIRGAESPTQF
jgi:hypothetical protein